MRPVWLLAMLLIGAGIWLYTHPDSAAGWRLLLPETITSPRTDRLYRWRDAQGAWQVTDTLPPPGTAYETLDYRDDVNVLPVPPQLAGDR